MKILIWRNHLGDPLSYLIEALSRGSHTHAAILIDESTQTIAEAYWPRLRYRELEPAELPGIDVYEIVGLTHEIEMRVRCWWDDKISEHAQYSIVDLLRFLAPARVIIGEPTPTNAEKYMFCSMAVVQCFADVGLPLINAPSWCVDPERLSQETSLKKIDNELAIK